MERKYCFILLFVIAVATVHLVSWVGSVLYSVPNGGTSNYAVFTFRRDQNKSLTTNTLMNVLIPNVVLIFIHMFCFKNVYTDYYDQLIYYVYFYYVYRLLLICVILNRRELFSIKYEILNFILGIITAYLVTVYILVDPKNVFIPLSELVNEFWLFVILVVYKFLTLILDKAFRQNSVVKEEMLDKYIKNKFNYFYNKYKSVTHITKEDNTIWVLLFSIMIFENYNRGKIIRLLENIKIRLGRAATVGIMQIRSDRVLSDEDSIILAYEKLKKEIVLADMDIDDEMQIESYARQYNPDDDYSKSVAFIYAHLREYLEKHPRYKDEFFLNCEFDNQEEQNVQDEAGWEESKQGESKDGYWTIYDVSQMSKLSAKQIKRIIDKKNMVIYLSDNEVEKVFRKRKRRVNQKRRRKNRIKKVSKYG